MEKIRKFVSVYLKKDIFRVVTCGRTTAGIGTLHYPVFFLSHPVNAISLGEQSLKALQGFTSELPDMNNHEAYKAWEKDQDLAMQIKSWRNFVKGTREVEIESLDDDLIKITPMKNLIDAKIKGKGDFDWLKERSRTVSREPQALGEAILAAFEDCE